MRTILNVVWFVFCGLWMSICYAVFGLLCCVTIIGIPFGIACFRIANYCLWPFGRSIVANRDAGLGSCIGNGVWILVAGLWLAIAHMVAGFLLCITIIGIPLGVANFKLIPVLFTPLGVEIVSSDAMYPTLVYHQK